MRSALLLLALVLPPAPAAVAVVAREEAAPDAPAAYDLRVECVAGVKVLVQVEVGGALTCTAPDGAVQTSEWTGSLTAVDEYLTVTDDHVSSTRTIVAAEEVNDGEPTTDEILGATLLYEETNGQDRVDLQGRLCSQERADALLLHAQSVGMWLALPEEAVLGGRFAADLRSLAALLFGLDTPPLSEQTALTLVEVDADGIARLRGEQELVVAQDQDGVQLQLTFRGDVEVDVDSTARRVLRVAWHGSGAGTWASAGEQGEAALQFHGEATGRTGPDAEAALGRQPVFRDRTHRIVEHGIAFDLPGSWFRSGIADGFHGYVDSQSESADAKSVLLVKTVPIPGAEEGLEGARKGLLQVQPKARFTAISGTFGRGFTTAFEADGQRVSVDFIAGKGKLAVVRIECPTSRQKDALSVLEKLRASLREDP